MLAKGRISVMECIVLPLYGLSLMELLKTSRDKKFSLKTVTMIGI